MQTLAQRHWLRRCHIQSETYSNVSISQHRPLTLWGRIWRDISRRFK